MTATRRPWKLALAFVAVSAAAMAITGLRVTRDVVPLSAILTDRGDYMGVEILDSEADRPADSPAARFVVTSSSEFPFRSTREGIDLIASGKGDRLVAVATVEYAFLYSQESAPYEVVETPPADRLDWFVDVIDRVKGADPGNGWFDLQAGTKLLDAAIEEVGVEEGVAPATAPRILDDGRFRAGLARLEAAAAAPFIDSRRIERMSLRALRVPAGGVNSISGLISTWAATLLPELRYYRSALGARLLPWIETSAPAEDAVRLAGLVATLMERVQLQSKVLIEWLVARSVEQRALESLSRIHAAAGRAAESRATALQAQHLSRWKDRQSSPMWESSAGSLDLVWMPPIGLTQLDTRPARELDWAILEEAVFAGLVVMIFLWGAAGAARAFLARQAGSADGAPAAVRLWTLRNLVAVTLQGALLPAIFFIVYNRTHPTREFGAFCAAAGAIFLWQPLTLLAVVVLLLSWLLRRSLVGTPGAPVPRRLPGILLAVAAASAGIAFFWLNAPPHGKNPVLFLLPLSGGIALLVAMASGLAGLRGTPGGPSLGRAQMAVALASLVVLTLTQLVVVHPRADRAIADYRTVVLEPWMQDEVGRLVQSNKVLLEEAEARRRPK